MLGKNGVGKSQFAKDLLLNKRKHFKQEVVDSVMVISSFSNIPLDIKVSDFFDILKNKFDEKKIEALSECLNLNTINSQTLLKNLSDGQKQKLKIIAYFLQDKEIIVLDELTNALDKKTVNDIYVFLARYIKENPHKLIINITHNLSDLTHLSGNYYLIDEQKMKQFSDKNTIMEAYIDA